ncbi:MAG TPA: hypothetical protein VFU36_12565 [Jatrophihabitans sp.]|nr:hypothetical protein [Jatrophihabitans sp.]
MKTSFDISEPLLREVKALARQRGVTTRSLVEQALAKLVDEARQPSGFTLPDLSVPGGLTPEFADAPWEVIRDEIYPLPKIRTSTEA